MTYEEMLDAFTQAGGTAYPDVTNPDTGLLFQFSRLRGPPCGCNKRPPSLMVKVYRDFAGFPGTVEFRVTGECSGKWLTANIYSLSREDAISMLPTAQRVGGAVWRAFCREMKRKV